MSFQVTVQARYGDAMPITESYSVRELPRWLDRIYTITRVGSNMVYYPAESVVSVTVVEE